MWRCPECHNEISELKYNVRVGYTDYGSAELAERATFNPEGKIRVNQIIDQHSSNDSGDPEWDGDPMYSCPECDDEVLLEKLIWEPEEETVKEKKEKADKEERFEEETHEIVRSNFEWESSQDQSDFAMKCRNISCKKPFVFNPDGGTTLSAWDTKKLIFVDCPHCGFKNDLQKNRESIRNGKFYRQRKIQARINRQ